MDSALPAKPKLSATEPIDHVAEQRAAPIVNAGRAVTLACITASPWFFGCVRGSELFWLYVGVFASAVVALIAVLTGARSQRIPWVAVPVFGAIVIGTVQLVPAGQTLAEGHIPQSEELSQWEFEPIRTRQRSVYPERTRREIARYSFALAAFFVGYVLFRSRNSARVLWAALAVNGLALVLFGLIQKSTWNGSLYWRFPLADGGQPFASFVNRNNAVSYLYICFAAAVGILVWSMERTRPRNALGLRERFLARIAALNALQVSAVIGVAFLFGGIVASGSRSGFVSAAIAAFVTTLAIAAARRSGWPAIAGLCALMVAAAITGYLRYSDELTRRMTELDQEKLMTRGRIPHWKDAMNVPASLPVFGAGLGTHRYAHLPFASRFDKYWYVNADNQYVETMVEAGYSGLGLVVLFLLGIGLIMRPHLTEKTSSAAVLGVLVFLFTSQVIHAVFDYGIIMPAVLISAAVLAGSLVARTISRCEGISISLPSSRGPMAIVLVALLGLGVSGLTTCYAAAKADGVRREASRTETLTDAELKDLIVRTGALSEQYPAIADLNRQAALLMIEQYERGAAAEIQRTHPKIDPQTVQGRSSLETLWLAVSRMARTGRDVRPTLQTDLIQQTLVPALDHLNRAAAVCPMLHQVDQKRAQLISLLSPQDEAAPLVLLRQAVRTRPFDDAGMCAVALQAMEMPSGRAFGYSVMRHALSTPNGKLHIRTLKQLRERFRFDFVLTKILPHDGLAALAVIGRMGPAGLGAFRTAALESALTVQSKKEESFDSLLARAGILRELRRASAYLEVSQRLAERFPGRGESHFELAQALLLNDQPGEALTALRFATGLDPENRTYQVLLKKLNQQSIEAARALKGHAPVEKKQQPRM